MAITWDIPAALVPTDPKARAQFVELGNVFLIAEAGRLLGIDSDTPEDEPTDPGKGIVEAVARATATATFPKWR